MKELPELERPYEKLELYGEKILSNAELLAIIIKTGTKDETAIELAQKILKLNDTNTEVKYVSTEDYYKPQYERALNEGRELHIAYRPRNSKLSKEKLIENGFSKLPEWKDAVDRYKVELKKVKR